MINLLQALKQLEGIALFSLCYLAFYGMGSALYLFSVQRDADGIINVLLSYGAIIAAFYIGWTLNH